MRNKNRKEVIGFRVTTDEKKKIEKEARKSGFRTPSRFLRYLCSSFIYRRGHES